MKIEYKKINLCIQQSSNSKYIAYPPLNTIPMRYPPGRFQSRNVSLMMTLVWVNTIRIRVTRERYSSIDRATLPRWYNLHHRVPSQVSLDYYMSQQALSLKFIRTWNHTCADITTLHHINISILYSVCVDDEEVQQLVWTLIIYVI